MGWTLISDRHTDRYGLLDWVWSASITSQIGRSFSDEFSILCL
jgi:hypothetical protein